MKRFFMTSAADQDVTVSSQDMERHLDDCDPQTCVLYSHSPSVQVYFALKNRLEKSSDAWLKEFVALDGLESLLDSLCHMVGPKFSGFSDAILQIDCLSCIRAVLNSRVGMDALVASPQGLKKLLKGVDLANTLPRKHVIEILSVVCLYSQHAYKSLLEAMDEHKRAIHLYHRFSFIVNELKLAETVPHKTAVLTLINSIICSTLDQQSRSRIRNEFIGLTLLDILAFLQREDTDEDLSIQLQVFQDKKHEDEVSIDLNSSVDLSCPQDLADAIQTRVFGSAKMVSFVNILQDLLAVETSNKPKSDVKWQIIESHIHHIVHAVDKVTPLCNLEAETLCQVIESASRDGYRRTEVSSQTSQSSGNQSSDGADVSTLPKKPGCRAGSTSGRSERRGIVTPMTPADSGYIGCEDKLSPPVELKEAKDSLSNRSTSPSLQMNLRPLSSDMKFTAKCIAAPMSNKRQVSLYENMSPEKGFTPANTPAQTKFGFDKCKQLTLNNLNTVPGCQEPYSAGITMSDTTKMLRNPSLVLRNIQVPAESRDQAGQVACPRYQGCAVDTMVFPTSIMKNLKWIKLDESVVDLFPHSLWASSNLPRQKLQPDFRKVEEMFKEINGNLDHPETPLLSNETRVRLNLFLNRLEEEPSELVRRLLRMEGPSLSLPFIKHLVDILPEPAEVKLLKQYNGNLLDLGPAEQFVLHLADLPDYTVLVTGHLRRAEFGVTAPRLRAVLGSMLDVSRAVLCSEGLRQVMLLVLAEFGVTAPRLRAVLGSMLDVSRAVLCSEGLRQVMLLVLRLGNFLNQGQFNGYAGGFTLSSLRRLADVKSNESGQNLVHFLVSVVEGGDERLFSFLTEIPRLEKASSSSPSDIKDEFDKLNTRINSFVRQLAGTNTIIREGFDGFLEEVKSEFRELQGQITELKYQSQRLSEFFCESEGFELQNCFTSLLSFFKELRRCRHEIRMLWKQKDMSIKRSNVFRQQLARKNNALQFGQKVVANSSAVDIRPLLVEEMLTELHRGNFSPALPELPTSTRAVETQDKPVGETDSGVCAKDDVDGKVINAAPEVQPGKDGPGRAEARGRDGMTTPDRDLNPMELSHISVVGTPMMNRPRSDAFDDELTLAALDIQPGQTNGAGHNLQKVPAVSTLEMRAPPILPLQNQLARMAGKPVKSHHRSRSDLGESMTGSSKWIRYQHQLRTELQAPLARPESSLTLATLNLESGGPRIPLPHLGRPIALVPGPTIAVPSCVDASEDLDPQEFVRGGKRGERKSGTLSNFLTKISKKVLRQKNSSDQNLGKGVVARNRDSHSGSEDGHSQDGSEKLDWAAEIKVGQKTKVKSGNLAGKLANKSKHKGDDKENINNDVNPFDRQKKNPIRLSNRFKNKVTK
ncbi:hypothetical protein EGW08_006695 [Elysia chlorotica]|uniref:FH2 domain-containing protein n=1 Tax=Elysia chlorotica TaxID=188477 RepID=A0A3S1A8S1_ELYCH|nr:hypothetical protein EGW08_006695 [Elysia chlorotica]